MFGLIPPHSYKLPPKNIKSVSSGILIYSGKVVIKLISSSVIIKGNIFCAIAYSNNLIWPVAILSCLKGKSTLLGILVNLKSKLLKIGLVKSKISLQN